MITLPTHATRRQWLATTAAAGLSWPVRAQPAKPILIGQSTMLSGPLAPTMSGILEGQQLALDEFNARGGVGGRPVKLLTLDDAYDAARCVENVHTLIDKERVTALFGFTSTANVLATLPVLADKRVPLIGVYTGAPALRGKRHPYFFTHTASYRDEVVQMVRNLKTVARSRIALVYMNNAFGKLMLPVVEEVIAGQGATLAVKASLEADGSDAVAAAQSLAAASPESVIFMAFGPSLVSFVRAAKAYLPVPLYAVSVASGKAALEALGNDARGIGFTTLVPNPFRPSTGMSRDFNKVAAAARKPVDYDRFWGYLNLRVLLEQLRRAGRDVNPQSLVTSIEQMQKVDIAGYAVSYSVEQHHGSNYVDIMIVGPGGRFMR
ncbi:MAG: hypothetical protein Tsb007_18220 [Rhizobacter sp.]